MIYVTKALSFWANIQATHKSLFFMKLYNKIIHYIFLCFLFTVRLLFFFSLHYSKKRLFCLHHGGITPRGYHDISFLFSVYTGWPKKVSHYYASSLNRIKTLN